MTLPRRTILLITLFGLLGPALPAAAEPSVGVVDRTTGIWYLRDPGTGSTTRFFYGKPGDAPFMGDWNCDGVDTPGLYRRSDGYVYLRNTNTQGIADRTFYFGNPGDIPVAGDFDGDGCDSVSIYRPSEQRFYLIDRLGEGAAGLGAADRSFLFGNPGDRPLAADFDGDGFDDVGVQRGYDVYYRTATGAVGWKPFGGGTPVASDSSAWGVGSYTNGQFDLAGWKLTYGSALMVPVAGSFGPLPGGAEAPYPYPNVGVGRRIIYHNGQQRVWLIEADGNLAHTWPVSGRAGVPAAGTYSVFSKSIWTSAGHDGIYMTHMVRFARGASLSIGFHSIPRFADGTPLQSEDDLGTYQSAGCVRQADANAVTLYDWAPVGTPVIVLH
jgi:L,D-transpeptidase catalytic domain